MEIVIDSKRNNPLLNRTEVHFTVKHEGEGTPGRELIRSELAEKLNTKKENIIVNTIHSGYGIQEVIGYAKVYSSVEKSKGVERDHILIRNKLLEPEKKKPVEKPAPPSKEPEAVEKPAEPVEEIKEEKPGRVMEEEEKAEESSKEEKPVEPEEEKAAEPSSEKPVEQLPKEKKPSEETPEEKLEEEASGKKDEAKSEGSSEEEPASESKVDSEEKRE